MQSSPASSAAMLKESANDPESFGRFYELHFHGVLRFVARRCDEAQTALDLTAETFAAAYLGSHRFRGETDEEAAGWLYTIARRQLARYLKKGKLEQRAMKRLGIQTREVDAHAEQEIERLAELDQLRATLGASLDDLTDGHRAAVELRIVEELPYPEVANRLDITESAARARVSRALRTLADSLETNPNRKEILA